MTQHEVMTRGRLTRREIERAIVRIRMGRSKVVAAGSNMSIAAVAREAGLSSASIHNNYPDLADRIRSLSGKNSRQQRDLKRAELRIEREKNKVLRGENESLRESNRKMASELAAAVEKLRLLTEAAGHDGVVPLRRR